MDAPQRFSPWRSDFITAFVAWIAGAMAAGTGLLRLWEGAWPDAIYLLLLAALFGAVGRFAWRNGKRRWYGKQVEVWATERLGHFCKMRGITYTRNWRAAGVGDVDFVADTQGGRVAVEVKSFGRWGQGWQMRLGERELAAIDQVRRQMRTTGAVAGYIWLPRGRQPWWQRWLLARRGGDLRVIVGNELRMFRTLSRHHRRWGFWRGLGWPQTKRRP